MKIGIDLSALSETWGGMHRYAFEFSRRLRQLRPADTRVLYFSDADQRIRSLIQNERSCFSGVKSRVFREQAVIPTAARKSVDRLLVPAYLGPVCSPVPVDLIVYDFLYLRDDAGHDGLQRQYWQRFHQRCLRQADRLFPISQATRNQLIDRFPDLECNVGPVLYPGAPGELSSRYSSQSPPGNRFILSVGTISPRKNFDRLLRWYRESELRERGIQLRIAGGYGWGHPTPDDLKSTVSGVRWEGRVSRTRLHQLYDSAQLLVFPSSGEGFGLPILEAFQHRLPVVVSDIPVFREVAGDAAWYLPENPNGWNEVIGRALDNEHQRRRRSTRGIRRCRRYRWAVSAWKYLAELDGKAGGR